MFLRVIKRHKDGKLHLYWTLVESVRAGWRVFQRRALYLGELNDSQRAEWQRAVEAFDEKGRARQLKLFPADRASAEDGTGDIVKVRMDKLAVRNLRNWGEVWLGLELWRRLGPDEFWAPRLAPDRKGTDWLAILKSIVMYRLTDSDPKTLWKKYMIQGKIECAFRGLKNDLGLRPVYPEFPYSPPFPTFFRRSAVEFPRKFACPASRKPPKRRVV